MVAPRCNPSAEEGGWRGRGQLGSVTRLLSEAASHTYKHNKYKKYSFASMIKTLIALTLCSPSSKEARAGSQGRNLGAGTEAETMAEHCLLPGFLWRYRFAFIYSPSAQVTITPEGKTSQISH